MIMHRRQLLVGASAVALAAPFSAVWAQTPPLLNVSSRVLEVKRRAAKVFGITNASGTPGILASEGDRFKGAVHNGTSDPLVMHWHGQIHASEEQDRSRPDGGELATGASDQHDFLLTPGTHWMHSHQLSEQQLLAAPMVTRERDAGDAQDVIVMLHDFAFRSPTEILAELGGSNAHGSGGSGMHGPAGAARGANPAPMMQGQSGTNHGSMPMGGMMRGGGMHGGMMHGGGGMMSGMGGMTGMRVHANDIRYDAYLANDRTLDDPEIVHVEKGGKVRLRIINGGTATAFFIDTGALDAECVAVDGSGCQPLKGRRFPLAQGQRIDLLVTVPQEGGAFPVFAQVEADRRRTGIVLATVGASVVRLDDTAFEDAPSASLALDERLRALAPLPNRRADRTFRLMLGEEPGYRWTINGKVHGEHIPMEAKVGERIEIMFMNPTMMMHPMHLHGFHFQVVGSRAGRFSGPLRDTVIVPPHTPILIAFDLDKVGAWRLHCHHLYHMATGMMTELNVS